MSQSEEKSWREERLTSLAESPGSSTGAGRTRFISFGNVVMCLLGFAIMVGGPTYERVCYSTLANLEKSHAQEGKWKVEVDR